MYKDITKSSAACLSFATWETMGRVLWALVPRRCHRERDDVVKVAIQQFEYQTKYNYYYYGRVSTVRPSSERRILAAKIVSYS